MKKIETEIFIDAPCEKVWKILTDLDNYATWNPFIVKAKGKIALKEKLNIFVKTPAGKDMHFKPTVISFEDKRYFAWIGNLLIPSIFSGKHSFLLEQSERGCKLSHKEEFSGFLVPLVWKTMETDTKAGFEVMNKALKSKAEETSD